jgi:hypothetical protein
VDSNYTGFKLGNPQESDREKKVEITKKNAKNPKAPIPKVPCFLLLRLTIT